MWHRFSILSTALPFVGLTMMAVPVRAADPAEMQQLLQQLQERIRVLEERLERHRVEAVDARAALAPDRHQVGVLEHPQVLGRGRARHRERRGQLARGVLVGAEHREHRAPRRVGDRAEDRVAVHAGIRNHEPWRHAGIV